MKPLAPIGSRSAETALDPNRRRVASIPTGYTRPAQASTAIFAVYFVALNRCNRSNLTSSPWRGRLRTWSTASPGVRSRQRTGKHGRRWLPQTFFVVARPPYCTPPADISCVHQKGCAMLSRYMTWHFCGILSDSGRGSVMPAVGATQSCITSIESFASVSSRLTKR